MLRLVDTHAHLEQIADLDSVLAAARSAGVAAIVAVGSDLDSNQRVLAIARGYEGFVFPALGLHPWNLKEAEIKDTLEFMEQRVGEAVGIGEVGLDYHKRVVAVATKDRQKQVLGEVLKIARRHDKPVLVHSRYAWRDCFDLVEAADVDTAVFHWFTGPSSVLRDIVARGYYVSATPAAEYHEEHRRAVREAPLDRLLFETDSPVTYGRGSQSGYEARPADVRRSLAACALLRNMPEDVVAETTTANAVKLFRLPV